MSTEDKAKELKELFGENALLVAEELESLNLTMLSQMVGINGGHTVRKEHKDYWAQVKDKIKTHK